MLCQPCKNGILPKPCVGNYSDYSYCDRCGRGVSGGDGNNEKECQKCKKDICLDCTAITGCQTTWGICKDCYIPLCMCCGKNISEKLSERDMPHLDEQTYCDECDNGEERSSDEDEDDEKNSSDKKTKLKIF